MNKDKNVTTPSHSDSSTFLVQWIFWSWLCRLGTPGSLVSEKLSLHHFFLTSFCCWPRDLASLSFYYCSGRGIPVGKARHEYYVQGPGFLFPYDHTEILALETFFFNRRTDFHYDQTIVNYGNSLASWQFVRNSCQGLLCWIICVSSQRGEIFVLFFECMCCTTGFIELQLCLIQAL